MGFSVAQLAADIAAMRSDASDLTATIVTVEATPQTVSATVSPLRRSDDVQDIGVFRESDLKAVCVLSDFSGSTPPAIRSVLSVTCSALGLSSARFFVESYTVDPGGVTLALKRMA